MTRGPLPDQWFRRDFPVLVEIARRVDAGDCPSWDELAAALGMSEQEIMSALEALKIRGLIDGVDIEERGIIQVTAIGPRANIMTGLHPSDDDLAPLPSLGCPHLCDPRGRVG